MKVNFFIPKYMAEFSCVGPDCNDTCCAGWDINIDKLTFEKYKNSTDTLKTLVDGKYRLSNNLDDSFNYGFMNVKDNKCPFLNDKLLCDIHGDCGEDNLSITCKRYPRVFNIIDDVYEKSGLPSCEEICKLAFLNKDKLEFIEISEDIDESAVEIRRLIDSEAFLGTDSLLQYFWDIRVISINIIQNRNFSIEERLSILKDFYLRLMQLKNSDDFDSIEELLDSYGEVPLKSNTINTFDISFTNLLLEEILSKNLLDNIRSVRLKELLLPLKENIIHENIDLKESILDNSKMLIPFSYIFENYLANQIFKDIIPFNKGEDFNKSIKILINSYMLIKAYVLLLNKFSLIEIDENLILNVIQSLSKDTEHNKVYKDILEINT